MPHMTIILCAIEGSVLCDDCQSGWRNKLENKTFCLPDQGENQNFLRSKIYLVWSKIYFLWSEIYFLWSKIYFLRFKLVFLWSREQWLHDKCMASLAAWSARIQIQSWILSSEDSRSGVEGSYHLHSCPWVVTVLPWRETVLLILPHVSPKTTINAFIKKSFVKNISLCLQHILYFSSKPKLNSVPVV